MFNSGHSSNFLTTSGIIKDSFPLDLLAVMLNWFVISITWKMLSMYVGLCAEMRNITRGQGQLTSVAMYLEAERQLNSRQQIWGGDCSKTEWDTEFCMRHLKLGDVFCDRYLVELWLSKNLGVFFWDSFQQFDSYCLTGYLVLCKRSKCPGLNKCCAKIKKWRCLKVLW